MMSHSTTRFRELLLRSQGLYRQGEVAAAHKVALRARNSLPGNADGWNTTGMLAMALNRLKMAKSDFLKAIKLAPERVEFKIHLANCLDKMERHGENRKVLEEIVAQQPHNANAWDNLAAVNVAMGEGKRAAAAWRRAIEIKDDFGSAYLGLAELKEFSPPGADLDTLNGLLARDRLSAEDRQRLSYALGRLLESRQEYEGAFVAYEQGNRLRRELSNVDYGKRMVAVRSVIEDFSQELVNGANVSGHASPHPIFIVGMPRSGTTLLEQMLAAHPEIQGAGERTYLGDVVRREIGKARVGEGVLAGMLNGNPKRWKKMGDAYLSLMSRHVRRDRYMVDKMPTNSTIIGFAHLIFPDATLIQCRRQVSDVAISCLASSFAADGLSYTLEELGQLIAINERMMAHWTEALPAQRIVNVSYEALVRNPRSVLQPLLQQIGVKWSDRCLEFHTRKGVIKSASYAQVRRGLYTGSIGRGDRFGSALDPVLAAREAALSELAGES